MEVKVIDDRVFLLFLSLLLLTGSFYSLKSQELELSRRRKRKLC